MKALKNKSFLLVLLAMLGLLLMGDANAAYVGTSPDLSGLKSAVMEFDNGTIFEVLQSIFGILIGIKVFKLGGRTLLSAISGR